MKRLCLTIVSLLLVLCLLTGSACAEQDNRLTFLLMCNEGMTNDGGNVQNTMMLVTFDSDTGSIRLLSFTWDSFVDVEGFDVPQTIDQPYRTDGPEGTLKTLNANFGLNLDKYISLNYLNLASLIDAFGGVEVDITRAERNALNGMVASKKKQIQTMADLGQLEQMLLELLVKEYYLDEWGSDVHLNGLQAVGFGWLQYDSVYNCCLRELSVIGNLFSKLGSVLNHQVTFMTDETGEPEYKADRLINLDHPTDEDVEYLMKLLTPIFEKSANNLTEEQIKTISLTLARASFNSAREGADVFDNVQIKILPLEALEEYDMIAGRYGHLVDKEANAKAINDFLYGE